MKLPKLNRCNPIATVRKILEADAAKRGIELDGKRTVIVIQRLRNLKLAKVGPSGRPRVIRTVDAVTTARFEAIFLLKPLGEIPALGLKQAYLMLKEQAKRCDFKGGAGVFHFGRRLYFYADWGTNGRTLPVIIECVQPLSDRPFRIKKKPQQRTCAA